MTERELATLLAAATGSDRAPSPDTLSELEAQAEERTTPGVELAVMALHDRLQLGDLPRQLDSVRCDTLVRWDRHTCTWVATQVETTERVMVRILRPSARRDPVLRRWFRRRIRALQPAVAARMVSGGEAALVSLPGPMATPPRASRPEAVRWWVQALLGITTWEQAGLGLPALAPAELRATTAGVKVVCLTGAGSVTPALAGLADTFEASPADGPLLRVLEAARQAPPDCVDDAAEALIPALAEILTAERHHLQDRWNRGVQGRREARLLDAVSQLAAAVPPPEAHGAIGVDLEGRITVVETRQGSIWWGIAEDLAAVYTPAKGFDAPVARRLLRARASAPPNPALDRQVDGRPETVEPLCRWIAAALRLRTMRMLLERARV